MTLLWRRALRKINRIVCCQFWRTTGTTLVLPASPNSYRGCVALPSDSLTDYNSADVWTRLRNLHRRGTLFPISDKAATEIASVHAGLQLVPDTRPHRC